MSLELKEQYEKVYAFCYFKVHNREVAEDITQETFLKYFETTQYLEKGKKLAFLYTIARNCSNDYFRKTKKKVDIDTLPELSEEIADSLETDPFPPKRTQKRLKKRTESQRFSFFHN